MAGIIYAVAGEGFGHSSRSHLIGQRLIDAGHDCGFVGSQKSLLYLKQYFGQRVKAIFGPGTQIPKAAREVLSLIQQATRDAA